MSVIRWEDPPEDRRDRQHRRPVALDHRSVAACLRRHPNRWGLIAAGDISAGYAGSIRNGLLTAYRPGGSFEAVSRTVAGQVYLYARYVGTRAVA